MPTQPAQWRTVIEKAKQDLDKTIPLISAYESNVAYPSGLQGDARYISNLTNAQKTAIVNEFYTEIDAIIASLQAARNAP